MNIEQAIAGWDGKSAEDIENIYNRYSSDSLFVANLIDFTRQTALQKGATWLLKHHLQRGRRISAEQAASVFKLLSQLSHWESMLHILQSLPYLRIGKSDVKVLEVFLRQCLLDTNKFVRAWAYNGFHELAKQHPKYRDEARQFFEMALKDEAPSVKARIRNIMKSGCH